MKTTITRENFINEFNNWEQRKDQFSVKARGLIYDYLEEIHGEEFENYEMDIVAVCCEFTEYESFQEYFEDYNAKTKEEKQEQGRYIIGTFPNESMCCMVAINH